MPTLDPRRCRILLTMQTPVSQYPLPSSLALYDDGEKLVYHPQGLPPCRDLVTPVTGAAAAQAIETVRQHVLTMDHPTRQLNRVHWLTRDGTAVTYTPELPPGKSY